MSDDRIFYGSASGWSTSVGKKFMFDPALSMEARALWIVLKLFLSPDKPCAYPSMKLLTEITGWHRQTLWRRLHELEEQHYLAKKQRGVAKSNLYALFSDPNDWRDPLHWVIREDGSVELGDADAPSEGGNRNGPPCNTTVTQDVTPVLHRMYQPCYTEKSKSDSEHQGAEALADVTDRPKISHSKTNPKEEKAASPLSPDFVSEKTPEEAQRQLKPGEAAKEDTVEFMVMEVAKNYPRVYMQMTGRRNIIMSRQSRDAATEFFSEPTNEDWSPLDVLYVGLKAIQETKAHPYPGKGNDDFWACRRFTSPNQIFVLSPDNDYRLIRMALELNYVPGDIAHDEVYAMIQDLIRTCRQKE